ncbi:cysteine-rich receptor-like protein kinase 10 isoform X1 [Tasmannia lanceolata]|uniref:cysteine-rich receptor-like protein kinase 10 isoform X1 n=1 Tax=Tasmannia lanceolata TaxID=3420 RepID=UPI004063EA3C
MHTAFNSLLSISYMLLFLTTVSADPFKFNCTGDNYASQSTFETNLNSLLSSLTSKAALGLYSNGTAGENSKLVYGLFLCKGDISQDACQNCIQTASKDIIPFCSNSKQAIVWYESCQLRYSDRNFLGLIDTSTGFYLYNNKTITSPNIALAFISNLAKDVQIQLSMFGTNESQAESIYGLAQCTKDLSSDDCGKCLNELINKIDSCCLGRKGWRYLSASCNIRYETYSFFNGSKPHHELIQYQCDPNDSPASQLFISNLNKLLSDLTAKTPPSGFYDLSLGQNTDPVYGLALCRGDVSFDTCQTCLQLARGGIIANCPNRTQGIIWFDECLLRYSNRSFIGIWDTTDGFPMSNFNNISQPDRADFDALRLFAELAVKASNQTLMFASDRVRISRSEMRYGLVQCTRDLSVGDCKNCLAKLTNNLLTCCRTKTTYRYFSSSCTIRYDASPFFNTSGLQIFPPQPTGTRGKKTKPSRALIYSRVAAASLGAVLLTSWFCHYLCRRRRPHIEREGKSLAPFSTISDDAKTLSTFPLVHAGTLEINHGVLLQNFGPPTSTNFLEVNGFGENHDKSQDLPWIDFSTIQQATNNFSDENKLGQGGFGPVYKGILQDGKEVAVKRLSRGSEQGMEEFKNEVKLIAKLQHRNLVRLLGCCMETEEMILVYEYMVNTSLDGFLYDRSKRAQLDWTRRLNIIVGISRGLLYLHEDSRLRIIHRDLKASNILLDHEMKPKISDFGIARIFRGNQSPTNTVRVVGTIGYMAPEYAMEGVFSVKSDVFSFGVLLLEIVSGKRNSCLFFTEYRQSLLVYAWKLWSEGKSLELIDPLLIESCLTSEAIRCIHIGLLCVQENAADRPTMSFVVLMLGTESISLPQPTQPPNFTLGRGVLLSDQSSTTYSLNELTISDFGPR